MMVTKDYTMTTPEFKLGQIWIAYVYFADNIKVGKVRPVVIVNTEDVLKVSVCRITSRPLTDPSDVFIEEWQDCGLVKPSCIRADIVFELPLSDILSEKPIGEINSETLMKVLEKLSQ